MKKILFPLFVLLVSGTGFAQGFTVNHFSAVIELSEKGYFDVTEKYDLTFETHKHGIYRTIQTSYDLLTEDGTRGSRKIRISNVKVPGYKFNTPFDFEQKLSNSFSIRIGDENRTLIGRQQYEIRYRVHNALLFEKDITRFYWNIKPDGWQADFHQIRFEVILPEELSPGREDCFVYSGDTGTATNSDEIALSVRGNIISGTSKEGFLSRMGQSVTVLINLPAGTIREEKPFWPFWEEYGWVFLVTGLFGGFFWLWRKYGKDERVIPTTSYYPPEGIDPAMAGFLINDKDDPSDLISLLPYWGSLGLLRIEEISKKGLFGKKDTKLSCLAPLPAGVPAYEREIFEGLFGRTPVVSDSLLGPSKEGGITLGGGKRTIHKGKMVAGPGEVLVSSLRESFYTTMNSARGLLKKGAQQYYEARSRKIMYMTLATLILATIVFTVVGLFFWGILAAVCLFISCLVLLFLNTHMVKRNARGNLLLSELKGFREFIRIAEVDKLRMLVGEDPTYFENTMAYALTFGLFEKWAGKFEALNMPPPDWYRGSGSGPYGMRNFSRSFSGAMTSAQSTMVSSPSQSSGSSGGGSSGGGFGGGGGGSW